MREITIGELINFIQKNKTKGVFREYSNEHLVNEILYCVKHNTLCYSLNSNGKLNGVTTAQLEPDNIYYIRNILTTEKDAIKNMLNWLIVTYPNYIIMSHHPDESKRPIFIPKKLLKRLSSNTQLHEH